MTPAPRQPGAYLHGEHGPTVVVPARIAAWLDRTAGLSALRVEHRGLDPELDAVLVALRMAALMWRERHGISTDHGTGLPDQAEQDPPSVLTTAQAADLLGITGRGVRKALESGRLPGERHGGRWLIRREDVEHYRAGTAA